MHISTNKTHMNDVSFTKIKISHTNIFGIVFLLSGVAVSNYVVKADVESLVLCSNILHLVS